MKFGWIIKIAIVLALVLAGTFLINLQKANYEKVIVKFLDKHEMDFIAESDIVALINDGKDSVVQENANLRLIEQKIKNFQFIKDCQVSRDLQGNLIVEITQNRPLGRLSFSQEAQKGGYISEEGKILPLSDRFTARVVLITGQGASKIDENYLKNDGKAFFEFLQFIDQDIFWQAQISQIKLDKAGKISFYTQIGEQEIILGTAQDFKTKLDKLYTFYQSISTVKGWKTYQTINLQYDKQIVCR